MPKINTKAIMTCPICGSKYAQKMPKIGKHINYKCMFCNSVFGITNINDCCVYCKHSNALCPIAQKKANKK
jgi:transposase-like protein